MQQETQLITLQFVLAKLFRLIVKWIKFLLYYLVLGIEFICLSIQNGVIRLGVIIKPYFQRAELRMSKRATDFFGK